MSLLVAALFLLALNAAASWLVLTSQAYVQSQKVAQLVVIWLLPILGALLCFFMLRQITSTVVKPKAENISNEYAEHYAQNYELHNHNGNDHQP